MLSDLMNQCLGSYPCRAVHTLSEQGPSLQKAGSLGTSDHVKNRAEGVLVVRQDTVYQTTLAKAQHIVRFSKPGGSSRAALRAVVKRGNLDHQCLNMKFSSL